MDRSNNRLPKRERVPLKRRLTPVSRGESLETLRGFVFEVCAEINSPRSLAVWILLREEEYQQLVTLAIDPSMYDSADSFADDYLVTKLLSKFEDFRHEALQPKQAALQAFADFENQCKSTNQRFRQLAEDPSQWDPLLKGIFLEAKRKISRVLGSARLDEIALLFGWGPGATTSTSGDHTSAYVKFLSELDVTSNCLMMGWACINSTPSWVRAQLKTAPFDGEEASVIHRAFNIVRGNEILLVPKSAKTDRVIAKEPTVNSYLQRGFGQYIRRRLRSHAGIDLNDQSINQRLAREGSITGTLATIDLKGASDTVSTELVRYLLPNRWFTLLDLCRSKQGHHPDGSWIHYEKFSSMGNTYTFELESLIFWALTQSVVDIAGGDSTVSVYGDDLIVPTAHYEQVARTLSFAGFTINEDKSFHSGPFRESCGADYYLGIQVRPLFIKESVSNVEDLYKLANGIRRYACRRDSRHDGGARFHRAWASVYDRCPSDLALPIPDGVGDGGFVSSWDEAAPSVRRSGRGWSGYQFDSIVRIPVQREMKCSAAATAASLYAMGVSPSEIRGPDTREPAIWPGTGQWDTSAALGTHTLRRTTLPRRVRQYVLYWPDVKPWLDVGRSFGAFRPPRI